MACPSNAGQLRFEAEHFDVRIQIREPRLCRCAFVLANVAGTESYLPLQVGEIHHIEIDQAKFAYARSREIQTQRRAEPTGSNQQYFRVFQLKLTLHAHFRHDQMAAVAQNFFIREARRGVFFTRRADRGLNLRCHKISPKSPV